MKKTIPIKGFGYFGKYKFSLSELLPVIGIDLNRFIKPLIEWREMELTEYDRWLNTGKLKKHDNNDISELWFNMAVDNVRRLKQKKEDAIKEIATSDDANRKNFLNLFYQPGQLTEEELELMASIDKLLEYEIQLDAGKPVRTIDAIDDASILYYDEEMAAKLLISSRLRKVPFSQLKLLSVLRKSIEEYKYDPEYMSKEGIDNGTVSFSALVEDIREHGLKQPLVVSSDYELLSGYKRYGALKELKLTNEPVEVIVAETYENEGGARQSKLEINATSNIKIHVTYWQAYYMIKADLGYITLASGFRSDLLNPEGERHDSRELIAKMRGFNKTFISRLVRVGDVILSYFSDVPHMNYLEQIESPESKMTLAKADEECRLFREYVKKKIKGELSENDYQNILNGIRQSGIHPSQYSIVVSGGSQNIPDFTSTSEIFVIWARNARDIGNSWFEINFDDIVFTNPNERK